MPMRRRADPFDGEEAQKQGRALSVLGLDKDIESIAQDDHIGRALQDQSLLERKKPEP